MSQTTGRLLLALAMGAIAAITLLGRGAQAPDRPELRGTIDPNGNQVERR